MGIVDHLDPDRDVVEEVFAEIVVLSELVPRDLSPVLESVARTGALVTAEEGGLTAGLGAELAARATEQAWDDLRRHVRRVAAADGIIPAAPELERAVLPSAADVSAAVASVA